MVLLWWHDVKFWESIICKSTITCNATSQCSWGARVRSQCARGGATALLGVCSSRYTRYPRYTRYSRYTRCPRARYTRYSRYTLHRFTKISSSQWSSHVSSHCSRTGMGNGLCWWCSSNFLMKPVWTMGFAQLNAGNHFTHKTCQQQRWC